MGWVGGWGIGAILETLTYGVFFTLPRLTQNFTPYFRPRPHFPRSKIWTNKTSVSSKTISKTRKIFFLFQRHIPFGDTHMYFYYMTSSPRERSCPCMIGYSSQPRSQGLSLQGAARRETLGTRLYSSGQAGAILSQFTSKVYQKTELLSF